MKEPPKLRAVRTTPPEEVGKEIIIQAVLGMTWDELMDDLIRNRMQYSEEGAKKCQAARLNAGCIKSGRT